MGAPDPSGGGIFLSARASSMMMVVVLVAELVTPCYGGCCQESGTNARAVDYNLDKFITDRAFFLADASGDIAEKVPGCCKHGPPGTCNWRRDCCNLGTGGYWTENAEYDPGSLFCESYFWRESVWGPCSSDCGEGISQRISAVACMRTRDSAVVPESYCDESIRPPGTRTCVGTWRCGYGFVGEEWGRCSVQCGNGVQQRDIACARSDGARVESSICEERGYLPPSSQQVCSTIVGCSYFFAASPWSTCNTACVQFRELTCMRSDNTKAESYFCSSLPNLPTSQACC